MCICSPSLLLLWLFVNLVCGKDRILYFVPAKPTAYICFVVSKNQRTCTHTCTTTRLILCWNILDFTKHTLNVYVSTFVRLNISVDVRLRSQTDGLITSSDCRVDLHYLFLCGSHQIQWPVCVGMHFNYSYNSIFEFAFIHSRVKWQRRANKINESPAAQLLIQYFICTLNWVWNANDCIAFLLGCNTRE